MSIQRESVFLQRMAERGISTGEISLYIHSTKPGTLVVDFYSRHFDSNPACGDWDIDMHDEEMMVLPFTTPSEFRRAYRCARLLRGRPGSKMIN
ncbi:hypothetical protein F6X50_11590 [Dickeya dianthicola]|uniref:Uncharacterized protein n=1 Tax=Dickeya undicola TaxID=1577887 RepID=A0ABX9WR21_9GAMM|nr:MULTISPECIES: hypothetical protein [Dickeya]MCI4187173.1 hypothetical protein [Dickeya dianthicola]MCI4235971.1 hypothetical protein [Dickeya dianthicola]MCI4253944.1 hypothetical protein [Dickeya dianthicola]MZG20989.1 hypothetical protein [Dickeya dianthicola]MZI89732.1 hypothetical protein [Dickeya dianthicola]